MQRDMLITAAEIIFKYIKDLCSEQKDPFLNLWRSDNYKVEEMIAIRH